MAPMKLAEFRYGREEMLALYDEVRHEEKDPPDEYAFLKQMTLWLTKPQTPLNKQVRFSENEILDLSCPGYAHEILDTGLRSKALS